MSWLEDEFATNIFSGLQRFKIASRSPFKLNARCPVCGDSSTDKSKARFWYYHHKGTPFVNCFNCAYTKPFEWFMKEYYPDEYDKWMLASVESKGFKSESEPEVPKVTAKLFVQELKFCTCITALPVNHPVVKYVENRKIPKEQWHRLWFTTQWQDLVNSIKELTYPVPKPEPRLVIPIFNAEGKIESFQGRALRSDAKAKYLTIKASEDSTKIYGQDTVDESKQWVYVMEGPIDTLFIPNSIAITGGSLDVNSVPYPDKRVWVLDNEPRHKDVKTRVNSLIEAGERVVLWDYSPWESKDVNEMILEEGATPETILEYFEANVIDGLMAQFRSSEWFKV